MHHFWCCPVAQAVVSELQAGLGGVRVSRQQLWLMQPVPADLPEGVWFVVCLAAVAAIDKGRRLLGGWAARAAQGGPPSPGVAGARNRAASYFWELLQDYAGVADGIPGSQAARSGTPFLSYDPQTGRLRMCRAADDGVR